ncbi:4-hydroxythreonine-4-phosphate dehydrogenase PdxA [Ornithinimicrobium sp. W1679]|uniref:4-hydroxythreonine-4-phosphate dehydrogenase PdxA n=1 Tax=Ornithinimicrobium sp. W1679 TaxID=3418770 RepID=UPI003CEF89F0
MTDTARPRIAMTMGDPSGIGPELAVRLLAEPDTLDQADVRLLATKDELSAACEEAGVQVPTATEPTPGHVTLEPPQLGDQAVPRGRATVEGGRRAMTDLLHCLDLYKSDSVDAIMFTPLNKSALHWAGMHEEDELRWFAKELGWDGTTSELNFVPGLTTSRVTSHVALSEVSRRISARSVLDAIRLLHQVVRDNGTQAPRLAVCALNPHAGENGQFGREEIDHIAPGVELARTEGIDASGPFPCDTIFIEARDGRFDGVVTMYHDQGQIAMKLLGFDQGVTVQGGLPVPIATPAHGTAYGIVGKGVASLGPTLRAFEIVVNLGRRAARARVAQPTTP